MLFHSSSAVRLYPLAFQTPKILGVPSYVASQAKERLLKYNEALPTLNEIAIKSGEITPEQAKGYEENLQAYTTARVMVGDAYSEEKTASIVESLNVNIFANDADSKTEILLLLQVKRI